MLYQICLHNSVRCRGIILVIHGLLSLKFRTLSGIDCFGGGGDTYYMFVSDVMCLQFFVGYTYFLFALMWSWSSLTYRVQNIPSLSPSGNEGFVLILA